MQLIASVRQAWAGASGGATGEPERGTIDRQGSGLRFMHAHAVVPIILAFIVAFSALAKVLHDERVVRIIHDVTRVPMKWFPWLAACEFAGAAGLLAGLVWPFIGLAASAGLIIYFIGAVVAHVRVGDFNGLGPATFILALAVASLVTSLLGV